MTDNNEDMPNSSIPNSTGNETTLSSSVQPLSTVIDIEKGSSTITSNNEEYVHSSNGVIKTSSEKNNNIDNNNIVVVRSTNDNNNICDRPQLPTPPSSASILSEEAPTNSTSSRFGGEDIENNQQSEEEKSQTPSRTKFIIRVAFISFGLVFLVVGVSLIWYYMSWFFGFPALILASIAIIVTKVGWRWFYIAAVTTPRDLKGLIAYIKLLFLVRRYQRKNVTVGDIFQMHVAEHPEKPCILYEEEKWSFREVNEYSNRIANLFHAHGYKRGDVVCLLLENRPEFVATWLGLSKLGVIIPLINTNLQGPSLLHCINVSECSALIYGESFADAVKDIKKNLKSTISLYQFNNDINKPISDKSAKDLTTLLQNQPRDRIPSNIGKADHHDKLLYIYTSGTTGLPKAAVISHSRYIFITAAIHFTLKFNTDDIFYTPLPLYHTAGGIMSMGQAIIFGCSVAIRKKFSATEYLIDCYRFNCTVAQYIGEMCRYMLAAKVSPVDKAHHLRIMFGNGLRPQIWRDFINRFNIPQVGEFYGATEGNANIVNNDNTPGAIGFISRIIPTIYPISIIRASPETGDPIRDANGLCQLCKPNEPGVFIGKIIKGNPSREFLGYVDKTASAKKIVHDVFRKGDSAFLSGDILIADEYGYLFFKDRTGDTFRWKGENVATSEVEAHVSNVARYRDTVVYGVTIPNTEGRAGMAAIFDPENKVNLERFSDEIKTVLPNYARPIFLRFITEIDMTGTFKLRKVDLQKSGYNPNVITDKLYYLTREGKYETLTPDIYEQIIKGDLRL